MVDTSDEWITKRTGIKERHIAEDETTSDMGVKAATKALKRTTIDKSEIDLIVCATISPDYFCMPSTATIIADKLGLPNVMAFDISAACTGFIYALSIAKAYIEAGIKKNVLIIGAERLSKIIDYSDRATCILFGDGAGAAIIRTPNGGSGSAHDSIRAESAGVFMQMRGNETFKIAVKTLTSDVKDILAKNGIKASEISHFVPHQANYRIIKAVGDVLKMTEDQIVLTVAKYGNTSSASIPMAINDIYESKKLKPNEMMLLDAFGGGLTWGSALVPFSPK